METIEARGTTKTCDQLMMIFIKWLLYMDVQDRQSSPIWDVQSNYTDTYYIKSSAVSPDLSYQQNEGNIFGDESHVII